MKSFDPFEFVRVYNRIQVDKPENIMVYHYTTTDALLSILKSESLWFSDRGYLNDASEGLLPLTILEEVLDLIDIYQSLKEQLRVCIQEQKEKLLNGSNRAYVLSFSVDPDSLCLWNYYTKGNQIQGYNIGFQAELLTQAFHGEKPGVSNACTPIQRRVEYDRDKQVDTVISVIKSLLEVSQEHETQITAEYIIDKITYLGYFFKPKCFSIENEYRMVVIWNNRFPSEEYSLKQEEYRCWNGLFIPYRQIHFLNNQCLKTVTVSPTVDFELARSSLKRALVKYPDVEIIKSDVPVRY